LLIILFSYFAKLIKKFRPSRAARFATLARGILLLIKISYRRAKGHERGVPHCGTTSRMVPKGRFATAGGRGPALGGKLPRSFDHTAPRLAGEAGPPCLRLSRNAGWRAGEPCAPACQSLVPERRLELLGFFKHTALNRACLPVSPLWRPTLTIERDYIF